MKNFIDEFKDFINKGNLLAIAIGFVMGAAFTGVVTAFVENVLMPIIGIPFGKPSFDTLWVATINDSQIKFGVLVTAIVSFVSVAFTLFVVLKAYNKATKGEAAAPPSDIALLKGILAEMQGLRDDMKAGSSGPSTD